MKDLSNNKLGIKCQWMEVKRALINHDGQVFPCCYIANTEYVTSILGMNLNEWEIESYGIWRKGDFVPEKKNHTAMHDYKNTKEQHNVFNYSLEEIVNNEWFTKTLPESWDDSDRCPRICKKFCMVGSNHRVGLKNEY